MSNTGFVDAFEGPHESFAGEGGWHSTITRDAFNRLTVLLLRYGSDQSLLESQAVLFHDS